MAALNRVLDSQHFHGSRKCSRFLRHIVEAAADGRFDSLKERSIGVDVFDREPHYDTNQDPIVRGTAGEVRKRLAQYYLEAPNDDIRFSLPSGSYLPEVHRIAPRPEPQIRVPEIAPPPAATQRRPAALWVAGVALCGVLVISWLLLRPPPLDRFWAPILKGKTVFVCLGQPQLYTFRNSTAAAVNTWFASLLDHQQPLTPVASVPVTEIIPVWDTSVSLPDAQATMRLVNLFARKGKQFDLHGERSVSLSDLRGRPTVFVGAFDNNWTMSLAGELRFYFDTDRAAHAQVIRDRQHPDATSWSLVDPWPPRKDMTEDYALVTRVINRNTERTVVILAGITQFGTEAAAELVTDPAYFDKALTGAPSDWHRKNMQFVVSTRVLSGVSGPPRVLASYFW